MLKNDVIISLVGTQVAAADNLNDASRQLTEMLSSAASGIVYDADDKGYGIKTVSIKAFKVMLNA